jgi:AcrR family transcriptional regulator
MTSRPEAAHRFRRASVRRSAPAARDERAPTPGASDERARKCGARAEAQRERILAAAQQCFIDRGFHAASMVDIAAAAGMSPGLIYRYFSGKSAIVLAIVGRQLDERRLEIAGLHATNDFAANVVRAFEQWRRGDPEGVNAALFLAMSADASREPQLAAALREADRITRAEFRTWLGRSRDGGGGGLPTDVVESRAILIQCVVEGLAVRAVLEPDLDIDRLAPALRGLLDRLLTP